MQPTSGLLSPEVSRVVGDLLTEVSRDDPNPIASYIEMAQTSPIVGAALDVVNLLGLSFLGDYTHPNPIAQDFIHQNFEEMKGSLAIAFSELGSVKPLGYAASEWGVQPRDGSWMLEAVHILDPRKYSFEGQRGQVKGVVYQGEIGDIKIPYDRLIHVTSKRHISFGDPYGVAECRRANAAYQAWKIVVASMLVAARRQAVPIVAGYSPSEVLVPLLGANGDPVIDDRTGEAVRIPAPAAMLSQLQDLENSSVISTDIQNRIEAVQQQTGGAFFFEALRYLGQLQLLSFLVPESILTATGVGDSNLNSGQRSTLEISVKASTDQIKEQLLDRLIRPLLTWQFGSAIDNWGEFVVPEEEAIDRIALLQGINQAVATGFFSAQDLQVVNRARDLAGIPAVEAIASNLNTSSLNYEYWRAETNGSHPR